MQVRGAGGRGGGGARVRLGVLGREVEIVNTDFNVHINIHHNIQRSAFSLLLLEKNLSQSMKIFVYFWYRNTVSEPAHQKALFKEIKGGSFQVISSTNLL